MVKRFRRKAMGGSIDIRLYDNGAMRAHVDHPSNDPEIEFAMVGRFYAVMRRIYRDAGLGEPVLGPVRWHDDPAVSGAAANR